MKLTQQIADDLRKVYNGGNWTEVSLKDALSGLEWTEAVNQMYELNSIAGIVFHMNYYIIARTKVLQGFTLEVNDRLSFSHPSIKSQEDWLNFVEGVWEEVETFAILIEKIPEDQLWEDFADPKYGSYYRNFQGIIEHCHYHIGQIILLTKIIRGTR